MKKDEIFRTSRKKLSGDLTKMHLVFLLAIYLLYRFFWFLLPLSDEEINPFSSLLLLLLLLVLLLILCLLHVNL